jgi:hypothetical protein
VPDRELVLRFLRELERADEEVGAVLAELDGLAEEAEVVRLRALELEAFGIRLPAERDRIAGGLEHVRSEVEAARSALAQAEEAVRRADGDAATEAARFETRARDRLSVAKGRFEQAEAESANLERRARTAENEGRELEREARRLAGELRNRSRLAEDAGADPRPGLSGIAEWGSAARAALFVARGQLAAERDAVIRQANELGALALGEPLTSVATSAVARRVERELSD